MRYLRRNIGRMHQTLRIGLGLGAVVLAAGLLSGPMAWGVALAGVGVAFTGMIGWCPACAAAGMKGPRL